MEETVYPSSLLQSIMGLTNHPHCLAWALAALWAGNAWHSSQETRHNMAISRFRQSVLTGDAAAVFHLWANMLNGVQALIMQWQLTAAYFRLIPAKSASLSNGLWPSQCSFRDRLCLTHHRVDSSISVKHSESS